VGKDSERSLCYLHCSDWPPDSGHGVLVFLGFKSRPDTGYLAWSFHAFPQSLHADAWIPLQVSALQGLQSDLLEGWVSEQHADTGKDANWKP
jgi:hypothetical protein